MTAAPAGYSHTPLAAKLGMPSAGPIFLLGVPPHYKKLLGPLPANVSIFTEPPLDYQAPFVHFFCTEYSELVNQFPRLKSYLPFTGQLWVSWPKKSSSLTTDLTENLVREVGLENGLVDVKVTAIDEDWSALKFVFRLKDRPIKVAKKPKKG